MDTRIHVATPLIGADESKQGKTLCGLPCRDPEIKLIPYTMMYERVGRGGSLAGICKECRNA